MKGQEALMSSARTGTKEQDEWRTPRWLFEMAQIELGVVFNLDAAASADNHLCENYITQEQDALKVSWAVLRGPTHAWCNPPYSMLREFADTALCEMVEGLGSITFLIPARTDTRAFRLLANHASQIIFLAGRVRFDGPDGKLSSASAPFPSAIIHLRQNCTVPRRVTFEDWRLV